METKHIIYIYVMNYFDNSICEIEKCLKDGEHFDVESILEEYDFIEDECHYMITEDRIDNIISLTNEHL